MYIYMALAQKKNWNLRKRFMLALIVPVTSWRNRGIIGKFIVCHRDFMEISWKF